MIPFKQWAYEEAARQRVPVQVIRDWCRHHRYDIQIDKRNARVWMVVSVKLKDEWMGKPFKEWLYEEAERQVKPVTPHAIYQRVLRGKYPNLKIVRASPRRFFVKG